MSLTCKYICGTDQTNDQSNSYRLNMKSSDLDLDTRNLYFNPNPLIPDNKVLDQGRRDRALFWRNTVIFFRFKTVLLNESLKKPRLE